MLAQSRGEAPAVYLSDRMQARYDELHARQPKPAERALRYHLECQILPGIALYQSLRQEGDDDNTEAILAEVEQLLWAYNSPRAHGMMRMLRLVGHLLDEFTLFRKIALWYLICTF